MNYMLKLILIAVLAIPGMLFAQNQEQQIAELLENWHAAAAKADIEAYFAPIDGEGVYIGTDASEYWTKKEFYDWSKPYFDKGKAWTFNATERHIFFSDDKTFAWFYEKLEASYGELRGSGVLRLKDSQWKILQYVLSLPVPNDKFKAVLEAIGE
jgi:SnoaL-like domain